MKERILTGWTFARVLYLGLGTMIIINSAMSQLWFGVFFGGYFAAMGLFAFGCAGGNCIGSNCDVDPLKNDHSEISDLNFEEVKQK